MPDPSQRDAWNDTYRSQSRQWKGVPSISFPFREGDTVLDLGCGNGKTSLALIEAGYDVIGIDFSDAATEACDRLYGGRMRTLTAPVTDIPLDDRSADGAVMVHILEHLDRDEMKDAVSEVMRIVRPGGKVFVRVFHADDMRADNGERIGDGTVVRGNGIRYHYFTEPELKNIFSDLIEISMERISSITKFNEKRSWIDAVFETLA